MAEVRLGRPQQGRAIRIAPRAQHLTERSSFDWVAEDRAGAVGFHVVHGRRVDSCVLVGGAQHCGLRLRVRRGDAVGAAVRVHRRALDDAEDVIPGCHRIGEALEHDHAGAVGAHDAVGVLGEGVDLAGRGQHTGLGESDGREGVGQQVHTTGDRHLRAAIAQGTNRLVDRHQRGGAGGVHRHRRPSEVKSIRNAVGDDGAGVAGQRIGVGDLRVCDDEVRVIVVRGSHEHAHINPAQRVRRDQRVLEGLPGQLQQDALLRVHVRGLQRGEPEELRVEGRQVRQVTARELRVRHAAGHLRVICPLGPAALRQLADAVLVADQQVPDLVGGRGTGVAARHADDGDVPLPRRLLATHGAPLCGRCRRVVHLALRAQVVDERPDGVVLIGHGGVHRQARDALQLAGEDHHVAG